MRIPVFLSGLLSKILPARIKVGRQRRFRAV
jgi:hypothetical protein